MLTESLTLRQEQFGRNHPVTAESLLNLAALRIAQKRGDEVVSLSREALGTIRQCLPERHARTATAALMPAGAWRIGEARVSLERAQVIQAVDRR